MCDPVSLGIAAVAMATVSAGVSTAGAVTQAKYEGKVAERNAALENEAMRGQAEKNRVEAQRFYRQLGAFKADQKAAMAANGIETDFGSAGMIQEDTARLGAEDAGQLYRAGNEAVRGYDINASNWTAQKRAAGLKATTSIVAGAFDVAGTALSGASQVSKMKGNYGAPGRSTSFGSGPSYSLTSSGPAPRTIR